MASVHKTIDLAIRVMALTMLLLGTLMMAAPFRIRYHNQALDILDSWRPEKKLYMLYCSISLSVTWHMHWAGVVVVLTSLIILFAGVIRQNWFPNVYRHKGMLCTIFVFLSMVSALFLITQEANNMGRIRDYDIWTCKPNYYHFYRLRLWFYFVIIPSNIVVGLCVIQHMAFLVKWILELTSNLTIEVNPGQQNPQQSSTSQPSSSLPQPPENDTNEIFGMRDLYRPPFPYQPPPQDCNYRCSYHTPQPPHCHQCHNEWHSPLPRAPNRRYPEILRY